MMYHLFNLHRAAFSLMIVGLVATFVSSPLIAASKENASSASLVTLNKDPRLDVSISVDETGIDLQTLLRRLSKPQLSLTADPNCQDQKLQIRLKQRPLRLLMNDIALLLPGQWERRESGYTIYMRASAEERRSQWWNLFLGERDQALAQQRDYLLQQMRTPPTSSSQNYGVERPPDAVASAQAALDRRFFNLLPPEVQQSVADQFNETPFYLAQPSITSEDVEVRTVLPVRSLPAPVQSALTQMVRDRYDWFKQQDQQSDTSSSGVEGSATLGDEMIAIGNQGFGLTATLFKSGQSSSGSLFDLTCLPPQWDVLSLYHNQLPDVVKRLGKGAPLAWKTLASFQQSRVWPDDPPTPASLRRPSSWPPLRRTDWLHWLAAKGQIEYVSDYYSLPQRPMSEEDWHLPLKDSLKEEMDYQATKMDMSWKSADGVYLLRDNRWYRDDRLEVPNGVLSRVLAAYPREEIDSRVYPDDETPADRTRQQLDTESIFLTSLTPWQIGNGLTWYVQEPSVQTTALAGTIPPRLARQVSSESNHLAMPKHLFASIGQRLLWETHTLEFYASLSEEARDALIHQSLPLDVLSPEQIQQAYTLIPELAALNPSSQSTYPSVLLGIGPRSSDVIQFHGIGGESGVDNAPPLRLTLTEQQRPPTAGQ